MGRKRKAKEPPPLSDSSDGDNGEYEVEHVLNKRKKNGKIEYYVKWLNYPEEENSWLSEDNLANCIELISEYERCQTLKQKKKEAKKNNATQIQDEPKLTKRGKPRRARKKKDKSPKIVVKCSLESLFVEGPHKAALIACIKRRCDTATEICVLASLLMLNKVNERFDAEDWPFFYRSEGAVVRECFYAVLAGRENDAFIAEMDDFNHLIAECNVKRPVSVGLSNIPNYLISGYQTNFMNNIIMYDQSRIKLFFRSLNTDATPKELKHTLKYMFNPKSKVQPRFDLIEALPNLHLIGVEQRKHIRIRGFFKEVFAKDRWFQSVIFFIFLQRHIDQYQVRCLDDKTLPSVKNFTVVPIHDHCQKHIRIDKDVFLTILKELKIEPKVPSDKKTGCLVQMTGGEFNDGLDESTNVNPYFFQDFWFPDAGLLDIKKIKAMEQKDKKFHYQIVTDGVSASVLFRKLGVEIPIWLTDEWKNMSEKEKEKAKKEAADLRASKIQEENDKFGRRFEAGYYDFVIGMDPGYKVYIAAVIKNIATGGETNIQIDSKEFYQLTRQNERDKKAKKLTKHYERFRRQDFENLEKYQVKPSPNGMHFLNYIRHRMFIFNRAIITYTDQRYTRLHFDKYIRTQEAMDKIVNDLTMNNADPKILFCLGGTEFSPSAPIKKYKRCPGVRKLGNFIKKKPNCDVLYVDEYRTSQVCGRCHRQLDKERHAHLNRYRHRYRVCDRCDPHDPVIDLPNYIITHKSQRVLEKERKVNENVARNRRFDKYNQPLTEDDIVKTVLNRDTSAARNILIKGICRVTEKDLPESLTRKKKTTHEEDDSSSDEEFDSSSDEEFDSSSDEEFDSSSDEGDDIS